MKDTLENIIFSGLVAGFLCLIISSCKVIGGIFEAGMGVGIFLTVLVIAIIISLVVRLGKK
jgi:hypothetical protein